MKVRNLFVPMKKGSVSQSTKKVDDSSETCLYIVLFEGGLPLIGSIVLESSPDESSNDEDFEMNSYIMRQFKKFMKNATAKGFDKDRKQSSSSQFKIQDKGKKNPRDGGQYSVPLGPKCFGCQDFGYMKQDCPTYLKTIRKSKTLAATLSDIELEDDSNNEDDGILNAFTATVNLTEGIVEDVDKEEELVESKFEKMDE